MRHRQSRRESALATAETPTAGHLRVLLEASASTHLNAAWRAQQLASSSRRRSTSDV